MMIHTAPFSANFACETNLTQCCSTSSRWNSNFTQTPQQLFFCGRALRLKNHLCVQSSYLPQHRHHQQQQQCTDEEEPEWSAEQLQTLSSLFRGSGLKTTTTKSRQQQKSRPRPLPLPTPYKIRPPGLPIPKRSKPNPNPGKNIARNPKFLVGLARDIAALPPESESAQVLQKWQRFLRKGSLACTIRELGRMERPERAMEAFTWLMKQQQNGTPLLYPDEESLAALLEVLACAKRIKNSGSLEKILLGCPASVYSAVARGFIRARDFRRASEVISLAKFLPLEIDHGVYAKFFLQASGVPSCRNLAVKLFEELAARDVLKLRIEDCTAVMKGCIRLSMYEAVERMFLWWKGSGFRPNVVMYTTLMHSRFCNGRFRDAMAVVWEMERENCELDMPAYRVIIRICVKLEDLSRAARYFAEMKEKGHSVPLEVYHSMLYLYGADGRLKKCREIFQEMRMQGFKEDSRILEKLSAEKFPGLLIAETYSS